MNGGTTMSDLLVGKDIDLLKKTVRSFLNQHILPTEQYKGQSFTKPSDKEGLRKKAQELGLWALYVKKEWGGAGLSLFEMVQIIEEASQHRYGLANPVNGAFGSELPTFLGNCTDEQVEQFIKPSIINGKSCYSAIWEEEEDVKLDNLTFKAVQQGENWILNGKKAFVSNVDDAGFGVILVHCYSNEGEKQPTLFLLDKDDDIKKEESRLVDVEGTHHLVFNDFVISDNRRIGKIGEGLNMLRDWIAEAQVLLSARCIGVGATAIELAKKYASVRVTRGKTLSEFPSVRSMIAQSFVDLQAARLMVNDAAKKVEEKENGYERAAAMAKVVATENVSKIVDKALQIHGGSGFSGDLPIERWYKEIRIARIKWVKNDIIIDNVANSIL